jgi:hypothetical protein
LWLETLYKILQISQGAIYMTFLISSLFYSSIGCLTGFFVHIFNGLIQSKITFDTQYLHKTLMNFFKVLGVMSLATVVIGLLVIALPKEFFNMLGTEELFLHQLLFYLLAFAAFDFGLKN